MIEITDHLAEIRERVAAALASAGRPSQDARILAVSKGHGADAVRAAHAAGQRDFGESYLQEGVAKIAQLRDLDATWHFVGRIQANKTRDIARCFDWVHTIDRRRVAERLDAQRPGHAAPLKALIQVNQTGEAGKAGVAESDVAELARAIERLPRLELAGLMCIPPRTAGESETRMLFARLRALRDELAAQGIEAPGLSMGMSGDFEAAIAEGSTWIRIGTALFGPRGA